MPQKEIDAGDIAQTVARLCQEANFFLPEDVVKALRDAEDTEESPLGRETLHQILENADIAAREGLPLCQDCGSTVILLELGQEVHIRGGELDAAVEEGVRQGYKNGYLRKSMVQHLFSTRINTRDNCPPIIHTRVVPGDRLRITVMPKGGGSENMTRLGMLLPAQGKQGVADFVVRAVEEAGSNPCPPVIVGVGIGGTADKAVLLSKEALLRPLGEANPDSEVADLEKELLRRINALGIGPQGFGGRTTALAVHAEVFPGHIASLPVAVNIQCHSARHKEAVLG
ncbi:MAG: fumarate hydratase [Chloroflexi bacterium]|nr:fumarate hydratase [Chloroflexota bacterium]